DKAESVYSEYESYIHHIDLEDCGSVHIEMNSGMIVSIDPSWSRPDTYPTWGNVTMKFTGTEGTLYIDAFKQHALYYNDHDGRIEEKSWAEDMNESLVHDFIDCVQTRRTSFITLEVGLRKFEDSVINYQ